MSPDEDAALYQRNSPINYVAQVETPLLLIHGELDERSGLSQAETFFYLLYRQNKPARLVRYWGENHSLALSPANIRDIFDETLSWFDRYLGPDQQGQTSFPANVEGRIPESAAPTTGETE